MAAPSLCTKWFRLTAQHWLTYPTPQADYDANSVSAYVQKLKEENKQVSSCFVSFLLKTCGSCNAAIYFLQRPLGLYCA